MRKALHLDDGLTFHKMSQARPKQTPPLSAAQTLPFLQYLHSPQFVISFCVSDKRLLKGFNFNIKKEVWFKVGYATQWQTTSLASARPGVQIS
jgi:hypothetical protein